MKKTKLWIVAVLSFFSMSVALAVDNTSTLPTMDMSTTTATIPTTPTAPTTITSPTAAPAAGQSAPAVAANAAAKTNDLITTDVAKLKAGQQTLRVGHYNQLPPFYFTDTKAQPGFGHEIFTEVAKKAGIQNVNFIGFDSTIDLNAQLREGKIDVIANAWDLPGMRKQFLLTSPYFTKGGLSFLYFKQRGSFQTVDDLKNHTIGVFKGGYAARYWLPTHGVLKNSIKSYETLKELMFALKDGNIDVAVIYYPLARLAQQQLSDQLASTLIQPINDVYAVRKQDADLQTLLDQAIQALTADGALDKIQAQYLEPANVPANPDNSAA